MNNTPNQKTYDLEERTQTFAIDCRKFIKCVTKNTQNENDSKQLVQSSGSVAANYIEANEGLSKKDFLFRIKICRKEAKESELWLKMMDIDNSDTLDSKKKELISEATQLRKIFGSIVIKCSEKKKN